MSPSSAGFHVKQQVEHYIGSYLISATPPRASNKHHRFKHDWAGGMPIFTTNSNYNPAYHHHQGQMSRLALHTQGVPLIVPNHRNRKNCASERRYSGFQPEKYENLKEVVAIGNGDALSVTSDESSGSQNSENSLPRIIKPRKRRKKDRKPTPNPSLNSIKQTPPPPPPPDNSDVPNLNHDFDDVKDVKDIETSPHCSCQCKLCDPSGQIWNANVEPASLRRSWSDPVSTFRSNEFGVIGSERQERHREWHAEEKSSTPNNRNNMYPIIDISTEIVTTPNGHRDLEIKFLSFSLSQIDDDTKLSTSSSCDNHNSSLLVQIEE